MRFIHLFLFGYVVLILGIGLALWQTGVLARMSPIWIGIGGLVAVGIGIMMSVSSGRPTVSEEIVKP
jgi:hypothetical protein